MRETLKWTYSALFLLLFGTAAFSSETSTMEVAQSVPIETTLAVPGIRQTQEVWLDMIKGAKRSIDLEEFYIDSEPGQSLEPVLKALRAAASRGVQIRFLLDSKFYTTYPQIPNELSQVPNIQVKTIDFAPIGGVQHSKYFIVDESEAFVGSANFDWLALSHIHEVGLHISDREIATNLEAIFSRDWADGSSLSNHGSSEGMQPLNLTHLFSSVTTLNSPVHLLASPPARTPQEIDDSLTAITQALAQAQDTINIQVYQYTTKIYRSSKHWTQLDSAIREAAKRGVHVKLMVDAVALKDGRADLKALAKLTNVEVRTVTIPQWSGGRIPYARLIHSKYLSVDSSTAWVGTENWSEGYFTSCRNVGLLIKSPNIAGTLNDIFQKVWNSSYTSLP